MSEEPETIWAVEVGDYEQTYTAAAFTTEELAERYAAQNGGHVYELKLYARPVVKVPYWQFGADVYPDGTVERWSLEHEADEPGREPVDRAERLHEAPHGPWDGHTQGHCGYHVCVFGSDRKLTEEAREHWVAEYLKLCNGTCPGCGRTENYTKGFWHEDSIIVHFKEGPLSRSDGQPLRGVGD